MLEEFKALIAQYPHLVRHISDIRESQCSSLLYQFDMSTTCAVINTGAEFGDIADVGAAYYLDTCWFNTLDELVASIAEHCVSDLAWLSLPFNDS
jgi:hypothetical protein